MGKTRKIELIPEEGNTGRWHWVILEYNDSTGWHNVSRGLESSSQKAYGAAYANFNLLAEKEAKAKPDLPVTKCEECMSWKDEDELGFGTCTCEGTTECGCRTESFHKCVTKKNARQRQFTCRRPTQQTVSKLVKR